jgi:cytoskeletal protein CcmA (bactofilin family)
LRLGGFFHGCTVFELKNRGTVLKFKPKAIIEGDVSYKALEMHQGAVISGQLRPRHTSSWTTNPP